MHVLTTAGVTAAPALTVVIGILSYLQEMSMSYCMLLPFLQSQLARLECQTGARSSGTVYFGSGWLTGWGTDPLRMRHHAYSPIIDPITTWQHPLMYIALSSTASLLLALQLSLFV